MPPRPATKAATAPISAGIGADSSTHSAEAALVDAPTGRLLVVGRAPHTLTGREGDPENAEWTWLRDNQPATAATTAAVRLPHDFLVVPRDTATWSRVSSVLDRATPSLLNTHS